jgi:hypothetical protein
MIGIRSSIVRCFRSALNSLLFFDEQRAYLVGTFLVKFEWII